MCWRMRRVSACPRAASVCTRWWYDSAVDIHCYGHTLVYDRVRSETFGSQNRISYLIAINARIREPDISYRIEIKIKINAKNLGITMERVTPCCLLRDGQVGGERGRERSGERRLGRALPPGASPEVRF